MAAPLIPVISPVSGSFEDTLTVTLSGISEGTIHYTTNGDDPSDPDTLYTTYTVPFDISTTTTIKACNAIPHSLYPILVYSAVSEATYTITEAGVDFLFTDNSEGLRNFWVWNFGEDATPATANTVGPHTVTYSSAGDKIVTLTTTYIASRATSTITKTINATI